MTAGPFAGRNAVVTGASRGIGAGAAERLAAGGANVALVARPPEKSYTKAVGTLGGTAEKLSRFGTTIVTVEADMAVPADRTRTVAEALEKLGGTVDILVNNAAANGPHSLLDYTLERRHQIYEINLNAPIDLVQGFVPGMIDKGEGWIVNISSGTARIGTSPPPKVQGLGRVLSLYGSSKAALNRITYGLAMELYGTGVRVNSTEPRSAVMSEGAAARGMDGIPEEAFESMEAMVESIIALCECGPEMTGRVVNSLQLLDELQRPVMSLDGSGVYPHGYKRAPAT
jgi:NAD(P)-dependent dehydrogenase (short-subunit alcohol dehydrogenase family)